MVVSGDDVEAKARGLTAMLGPTNTGKTHAAIERMLAHRSGMIGLPLRLLAREVYDRITTRLGERRVALVTGEEKRVPPRPDYWVCTVESMPVEREVDFLAVDEVQLAAHRQRGHTFTERLLHARGRLETWLLGADTMRPLIEELLPTAVIQSHPRFSRLSHCGASGLGSLPPRTAVVAFSVAEVYELAERIRQRHGGTAVVLGALSPRTRNAQVAMYEAGEVHYMVATDAIGMGLNLDVDRVVFASLDKFDGRELRPLSPAELGQIAGRAGRYTRDGAFGTLRPIAGLTPRQAEAVENHRFAPVRRLVWRNADLDFDSVDGLVASLRRRPDRGSLRLVEQADDYDALLALARHTEVRRLVRSPEMVELLWDVCRIPDFRKLLLDSHVQLLARIYAQLAGDGGRIDIDWMAERIRRLDRVDGDIDTLMNRIAFIRTWTYVTNHERWVPDAGHWQEVTRAIEDRQSDALHRGLTARFVERQAWSSAPAAGHRRPRPRRPVAPIRLDPASPFAVLGDLRLPGDESAEPLARRWVDELVESEHAAFGVDVRGNIAHRGRVVGRLRRGADLLHPEVGLCDPSELGAGASSRVTRRLVAWARDAVSELLAPLRTLAAVEPSAPVRGLAYRLEQGLGTVDRRGGAMPVGRLMADDRARLEDVGVEIGRGVVFLPAALRPGALSLRTALWAAHRDPARRPEVPPADAVSLAVTGDVDSSFFPHVGFVVRGPRAIRADHLERVDRRLRDRIEEDGSLTVPAQLGAWLGCRRRQLSPVLRAMGYRPLGGDRWGLARPRRRRRSRRRAGGGGSKDAPIS